MAGIFMAVAGGAANPINITARTVTATDFVFNPDDATATATYTLLGTGVAQSVSTPGSTVNHTGEWLVYGNAGDYEVRFTLQSGTCSGTFGLWLNLSASRSIANTAIRNSTGEQTVSGVVLVEIRNASNGVVLGSASITVTAQATVEL